MPRPTKKILSAAPAEAPETKGPHPASTEPQRDATSHEAPDLAHVEKSGAVNPLTMIKAAVAAVPEMGYAVGAVGFTAVTAVGVSLWAGNATAALIATAVGVFFAIITVVFAALAKRNPTTFLLPAKVLVWTVVILFALSLVLLFTSFFFGFPRMFRVNVGPVSPAEMVSNDRRDPRGEDLPVQDLLRLVLIDHNDPASGKIGRTEAEYTFMTPTAMFMPRMPTGRAAAMLGEAFDSKSAAGKDLLIMRCKPSADHRMVPMRLATWPAVFDLLAERCPDASGNVGGTSTANPYSTGVAVTVAPPPTGPQNPEVALFCKGKEASRKVVASHTATEALADVYASARELILLDHELKVKSNAKRGPLSRLFSVDPVSFSGLGMSAHGGGDGKDRSATEVLVQARLTEMIVQNVSLENGGCHCVRSGPYSKRAEEPLDPEFVWEHGTVNCAGVERLMVAQQSP